MKYGVAKTLYIGTGLLVLLSCLSCASKSNSTRSVDEELTAAIVDAELSKQQASLKKNFQVEEKTTQATSSTYHLREKKGSLWPGMEIALDVVEDPDLNGKYRIAFDGTLKLPYEKTISAIGHTRASLKKEIAGLYRSYFQSAPSVSVTITDDAQLIAVQGLVTEPGQVPVQKQSSLDQVIAAAGGLLRGSDQHSEARYVLVEQGGATRVIKLSDYYAGVASPISEWRGGDRVFFQSEAQGSHAALVEQRDAVQILGQVKNPGEYPLFHDKGVFHYLAQAGGPTEQADFSRVELVRIAGDKKDIKQFSLTEKGKLPGLQAGDILLFHAREDSKTVGNVTGIINSIATALIAALAI